MSAADLHIHSAYSVDGQYRPDDLTGLAPTLGSDFLGKTKPDIKLGSVDGPADISFLDDLKLRKPTGAGSDEPFVSRWDCRPEPSPGGLVGSVEKRGGNSG